MIRIPQLSQRTRHLLVGLAVLGWVTSVAAGFAAFMNYEATSGIPARSGASWPADTRLERVPGRYSLVMVAHPRCPCTRASLEALHELSLQCASRVAIDVVFWMPHEAGSDWVDTPLCRQAMAIPGARLHQDLSGVEAQRFGAATSGQVLVYDETGKCVFRGGITTARGKFGDSDGAHAIRQLINHQSIMHTQTPVFGCPLCRLQNSCDKKVHCVINCH